MSRARNSRLPVLRVLALLGLGGVWAVACGGPQPLGGAGSVCFRADECQAGLACVAESPGATKHVCSADLSGIVSMVDGAPFEGGEQPDATAGAPATSQAGAPASAGAEPSGTAGKPAAAGGSPAASGGTTAAGGRGGGSASAGAPAGGAPAGGAPAGGAGAAAAGSSAGGGADSGGASAGTGG